MGDIPHRRLRCSIGFCQLQEAKTKSNSESSIEVETSSRLLEKDIDILDGCVKVPWQYATDNFVLWLHFCYQGPIIFQVLVVYPIQGRAVMGISAIVHKHSANTPDLYIYYQHMALLDVIRRIRVMK